jgi:hypothetical protein
MGKSRLVLAWPSLYPEFLGYVGQLVLFPLYINSKAAPLFLIILISIYL